MKKYILKLEGKTYQRSRPKAIRQEPVPAVYKRRAIASTSITSVSLEQHFDAIFQKHHGDSFFGAEHLGGF